MQWKLNENTIIDLRKRIWKYRQQNTYHAA